MIAAIADAVVVRFVGGPQDRPRATRPRRLRVALQTIDEYDHERQFLLAARRCGKQHVTVDRRDRLADVRLEVSRPQLLTVRSDARQPRSARADEAAVVIEHACGAVVRDWRTLGAAELIEPPAQRVGRPDLPGEHVLVARHHELGRALVVDVSGPADFAVWVHVPDGLVAAPRVLRQDRAVTE